jgi:hypothetical protein
MYGDVIIVTEPRNFEVEIATENLKYIIQIFQEQIHIGGNTLPSENLLYLISSLFNKEEFTHQWKEPLIVLRLTTLTVIILEYHLYKLHTKIYPILLSQG